MVDTVLQYLITAKNSANKEFDSLHKNITELNDDAGKTRERFHSFTAGFADIKAGFDMVVQVGQVVHDTYQQVMNTTVEYIDRVDDLKNALGTNAEEASSLILITERLGISTETTEQALQRALINGVVPNIEGLSKLADQYVSIQSPIDRAQLLTRTFGRAGAELAPLMENGRQGIAAMEVEVKKYGAALTEAQLAQAEQLKQAQAQSEQAARNFEISWGVKALPLSAAATQGLAAAIDALAESNNFSSASTVFVNTTLEAYRQNATETVEALADLEEQQRKTNAEMRNMPSSVNKSDIVGHGQAYKHGQGPAYPYSESNPTGYKYDPYTGQYDYPGRAGGGPVFAGIPRVVGERRAEVFTPEQSGQISPEVGAGGAGNFTIQVNNQSMFSLADEAQARQVLYPIIQEAVMALKQNGKI